MYNGHSKLTTPAGMRFSRLEGYRYSIRRGDMKRERLTARDITILVSVVVLAVCCICVGLVLTVFQDLTWILTAPLRWLSSLFASGDASLPAALRSGSDSIFLLGACTFPHTGGSQVSSRGETRASDLTSEQVIDHFYAYFEEEYFQVSRGEITTHSGIPVQVSELTPDSFYLSLIDEERTSTSTSSTSVEGVVHDNVWTGSYYASYSQSTVISGQGIEEALTITADFSCPLVWQED
jgi:hypothetical protein